MYDKYLRVFKLYVCLCMRACVYNLVAVLATKPKGNLKYILFIITLRFKF